VLSQGIESSSVATADQDVVAMSGHRRMCPVDRNSGRDDRFPRRRGGGYVGVRGRRRRGRSSRRGDRVLRGRRGGSLSCGGFFSCQFRVFDEWCARNAHPLPSSTSILPAGIRAAISRQ
jgi:hypothetical protein